MREIADRETILLIALRLMAEAAEPVGNHRLLNALADEGIQLAEATAGRILREISLAGYAETVGRRGRVLTAQGRAKLIELTEREALRNQTARLVEVFAAHDVERVIDLLLVRRAVEPEAARLAAERATEDEIAAIRASACDHCNAVGNEGERLDPALRFHDAVIRASHNDILVAVGPLILQERNLEALKVLDRIALDPQVSHTAVAEAEREAIALADDHTRIMNAIAARNPDLAAQEMFAHMDRLIDYAKRYLNIVSAPQEQVDG